MTLEQLEHTYNFHDCDVFTPFEINDDYIVVTFDLAKHLQYDDLKSRQGKLLQDKDYYLIAKVKFSDYSNLSVSERTNPASKATKKGGENEKTLSIEQFNSDVDFISLAVLGENKICFTFEKCNKSKKIIRIQFVCGNIEVLEEALLDAYEYDKLEDDFD